jgi:hypothetical protein
MKAVARLFSDFTIKLSGKKLKGFLDKPLGSYLSKISHAIGEINQNLEVIRFAETSIAAFEPGNLPLRRDADAARHIRYHYANYLLRTTKHRDLSLGLINHSGKLAIYVSVIR